MKIIPLLIMLVAIAGCESQWNKETRGLRDLRENLVHDFGTQHVSVERRSIETKVNETLTDQKYVLEVEFASQNIYHSWSERNIYKVVDLIHFQSFQPLDSVVIIVKKSETDALDQIVRSFSADSLSKATTAR